MRAPPNNFFSKKKKVVVTTVCVVGVWLLISLGLTFLSAFCLYNAHLGCTQSTARTAQPAAITLSWITLGTNHTVEVWKHSLSLLTIRPDLTALFSQHAAKTQENMQKALVAASGLLQHAPHSPFTRKYIPPDILLYLEENGDGLAHLINQLIPYLQGDHTLLILLQNADELRATGGFLGSYALVNIQDGVITDVTIEDVYDADGQFAGFVSPPYGVLEYLSSEDGLRLPDANWYPEFPRSAQTILTYLSYADHSEIDLVIGIHTKSIERLLTVLGPLYLPDYDTTLDAHTLTNALHDERGAFFPGSREKTQLLSHTATQLQQTVFTARPDIKRALALSLLEEVVNQEVLLYAVDPQLQQGFEDAMLSGGIGSAWCSDANSCTGSFFASIESNVGINKANKQIERNFTFTANDHTLTATITYTNNNTAPTAEEVAHQTPTQAPHRAYVNYQRVLFPPNWTLQSVTLNGEPVSNIYQQRVSLKAGEVNQVGFLIVIKEQESSTLQLTFTTNEVIPALMFFKQPGVPAVTLRTPQKEYIITQSRLIPLSAAESVE
ncbi:MAG: DUF4012 domain-containing protein [Pseudomonadales bacterium]|nr:DUF4012 domain-containing protein [Candidatus Woesebacteria bacterium]MCB9801752.1 DUF4012 domain-containing protein [Pseudomonadales bacterium]